MHVLLATDGSQQALKAARFLGTLANPAAIGRITVVAVIRPLAAMLSLRFGVRRGEDLCGLDRRERAVVAFFGVRGIGSVYSLAYALGQAEFPDARWLWSTVAFTIVASVVIHGVSVNPAMRWVERHRGPQAEVTST